MAHAPGLAEIDAAGQFPDTEDIEPVAHNVRTQGTGFHQCFKDFGRSQVAKQFEMLAQRKQGGPFGLLFRGKRFPLRASDRAEEDRIELAHDARRLGPGGGDVVDRHGDRGGVDDVTAEIQENEYVGILGPSGSGKSTTLAAMIDYINSQRCEHIITIEDPIEFVHESKKCLINQREVHRDTLGFAEALRSALREDPDIILVGEMRDIETIRLALTAAETGHLVFGTLHTSSAAKTIDRIIDVFPAAEKEMVRSMLSESLRAVISQTLLKKVGGGRVAAHEIMVANPAIRNLIREAKVAQMYSAIQTGQGSGMQTLDQNLQGLLQKGIITKQEAASKAANKDNFV